MKNIVLGIALLSLTSTMAFSVPPVALEENERVATTIAPKNNSLLYYIPLDFTEAKKVAELKPTTFEEEEAKNAVTSTSKKSSFFGNFVKNCVEKVSSFFNKIKSVFGF